MVNIIQLDRSDLQQVVSEMVRESFREFQKIPKEKPLADAISIHEAQQHLKELGVIYALSSLYKASSEGTIPLKKYAKRLVFSRKDLTDWVNSGMPNPSDEMAAQQLSKKLINR